MLTKESRRDQTSLDFVKFFLSFNTSGIVWLGSGFLSEGSKGVVLWVQPTSLCMRVRKCTSQLNN